MEVDEAEKNRLERQTWIPRLDTYRKTPHICFSLIDTLLKYGILLLDHIYHSPESFLGTCNNEETKFVQYVVQSAVHCRTIRWLQNG